MLAKCQAFTTLWIRLILLRPAAPALLKASSAYQAIKS
jgi:hypothetical protein